ncbi:beta-phosphoglucomutase [Ruminiclostridium cellobioparum]|jgi:beta-phosphoglucomutase|uniref:beta-phosphoglucomutase n=1 Tax=Ruminiclostridium cellobioparum TaxID=29355 RepID=UPI0028ADB219|nr:beta-phosphoglucomutase [Ruminiclostridium cellobioparum]
MTEIKRKFKAALFDLDGVIVDTAKYHYLAWKKLASILNIEFTLENNERLKGVSRMRSLDILLELGNINFSEEQKIKMADQKNNWYVGYISEMNDFEILPGAKECLTALKENGTKIALGSASKNALMILEKLKIISLFDSIIDGNKVSKAKPDPEVFLLGAGELGVKPEECVVFEDAEAGIQAAKLANMYAVGIGDFNMLKEADTIITGLDKFDIYSLF